MNLLDDHIPLYVSSWMDTGPIYHYANCGRLVVLLTYLGAIALAAGVGNRGWALWFGVLGVATFLGFPTELAGGLLLLTYPVWALKLAVWRQPGALWPALGLVALSLSFLAGFPRTFVVTGSSCRSNLRMLATAVEMYGTDYQLPPPTLQHLIGKGAYLRTLPVCGAGALYQFQTSGLEFTLTCKSGLHPSVDRVDPFAGTLSLADASINARARAGVR